MKMFPTGDTNNLVEKASIGERVPSRATTLVKTPRYSLPVDIDRILCAGSKSKETNIISTAHTERMIMPVSLKDKSAGALDDESVDLNEPRFETFRVANFKSP